MWSSMKRGCFVQLWRAVDGLFGFIVKVDQCIKYLDLFLNQDQEYVSISNNIMHLYEETFHFYFLFLKLFYFKWIYF